MDRGTWFSLALQRLGNRQYVAGTEEAVACEMQAQHVLAIALNYSRWSFLVKRTELNVVDGTTELPADCMRVLSCSLKSWRVESGRVLRSLSMPFSGKVELTYCRNDLYSQVALPHDDEHPQFCEACICLLAAALAPRLTGNFQLADRLQMDGMRALAEARLKDAQTGSSADVECLDPEDFLD